MSKKSIRFAAIAAFAALSVATRSFAQQPAPEQATMHYGVIPWSGGTTDDALNMVASGTTIPMSTFNHTATKDGKSRKVVIVGGNPFGSDPDPTTINAVVIPVSANSEAQNGMLDIDCRFTY